MKNLPKINSIIHSSSILIKEYNRNLFYEINEEEKDKTGVHVVLPYFGRPEISEEIVDSSSDFINGFKVVKTSNGEYAYLRQSDSKLLPYRYDVARDFNEYGFAMVGKDGSVSWIDTNFKYLNIAGKMVEESPIEDYHKFNGWQGVSAFSQGDNPLSKVYDGRNRFGRVSYFGTDGELRKFYRYDGEIDYNFSEDTFVEGSVFDENGQAMADGKMLFSKGYFLSQRDLIVLCDRKGFLKTISAEAEKCLDEKNEKVLKKTYKSTNIDGSTTEEK